MTLHLRQVCRAASLTMSLLIPSLPAVAQDGPSAKINDFVRSEMARHQIPGLALLVLRERRVVFAGNFGVGDRTLNTPVTERTSFEIASMTKPFTDAAVLLLAEQGKLAVTDLLARYFPDLPPAWQTITIQQLMNHTAGLRDDWDEDDLFFTSNTTTGDFFEALKAAPLAFAPGTDWSYSAGPFVLGMLIERLSGVSYAQFMRESIFGPLRMVSTDVNDSTVGVPERASGYVVRSGVLQSGARISPAAHARADVGIRTTVHDLGRWSAALDDQSLLSAASHSLMFTPGRLNNGDVIAHGLGWFVTPFRGHTEIAHGGRFRTGFSSILARYPDDGLTIILLTNQFGIRPSEMAREIASFYNDEYRPIREMRLGLVNHPSRTTTAARIMNALKDGIHAVDMLPGVGRLGGWSRMELRQELAQASPPTFIDCQNLAGTNAVAFGTPIVANCFYRTEGDRPRYWTISFTESGLVAYVELEQ